MKGRIGVRITSTILLIFSLILFITGLFLQRRSVNTLERYYDKIPSDAGPIALSQKQRKLKQNQNAELPDSMLNGGFGRPQGEQSILSYASELSLRERFKGVGYFTVVRNMEDMCNAAMIFADLETLGSKGKRALAYPEEWEMQLGNEDYLYTGPYRGREEDEDEDDEDMPTAKRKKSSGWNPFKGKKQEDKAKLARKARAELAVRRLEVPPLLEPPKNNTPQFHRARRLLHQARALHNVQLLPMPLDKISPFLAFTLKDLNRVLYISHPARILRNMDEMLLHSPSAVFAGLRASSSVDGKDFKTISSDFMIFTPAEAEWKRLSSEKGWEDSDSSEQSNFAMRLYRENGMFLPRWPLEVHISELFSKDNMANKENFSPRKVLSEVNYVLFDGLGYPSETEESERNSIPQPWKLASMEHPAGPACLRNANGGKDCAARDVWKKLYDGFREQRIETCGLDVER